MSQPLQLLSLDPLAANSIEECFQRSEVFNFAQAVQARLITPSAPHAVGKRLTIAVRGQIELPDGNAELRDLADCSFEIATTWRIHPPHVDCHEAWFRNCNLDWHSYQTGGLCYEFQVFWKDRLAQMEAETGTDRALQFAVDWCLKGVGNLLSKHLLGERLGLKTWPTKWSSWPHGFEAANRIYELEKASHR